MSNRLKDKMVVLSAAGQGIGRASALMMADEGARVIATDINEQNLDSLNRENCRIESRRLDVTDAATVVAFARRCPHPDVLFNCAGYVNHGTIMDCE